MFKLIEELERKINDYDGYFKVEVEMDFLAVFENSYDDNLEEFSEILFGDLIDEISAVELEGINIVGFNKEKQLAIVSAYVDVSLRK